MVLAVDVQALARAAEACDEHGPVDEGGHAGRDHHDDLLVFAALGRMHRQRVGVLNLVHCVPGIVHHATVIKLHPNKRRREHLGIVGVSLVGEDGSGVAVDDSGLGRVVLGVIPA